MSNSLFDFTLPFESFAPFAPLNMLAPPAQRWLDFFTGASQAMSDAMGNAMGLQDNLYQRLLAGQMDPFKAMARYAPAPAAPLDWVDTGSRASVVMSKALSRAAQRQMELCQSWLTALQEFTPATDAKGPHDHVEWLHGQTVQVVTQLRGIVDECLEAWFAAAGIIADAYPAATPDETAGHDKPADHAAAKPANDGQTPPAASRTTSKRR